MNNIVTLTSNELVALIEIGHAQGIRASARHTAKAAKKRFDVARSDAECFYLRDDGNEYLSEYRAAKDAFEASVRGKIESEKDYKRKRLTAIRSFPRLEGTISKLIQNQKTPQAI